MSNYAYSETLPSWLLNRSSGVLLHPTALPGQQGIGSLGSEAMRFVDFLESAGFSYWQTCPLGPTGFGDSPYQVFCSSAGNPYLIDWNPVLESDLIGISDLNILKNLSDQRVDYGSLYNCFYHVARIAFSNFRSNSNALESMYGNFDKFKNRYSWLKSYGVFQALKLANNNDPWWLWNSKFKKSINLDDLNSDILDEVNFHFFLQYLFFGQWLKLKEYANQKGIFILGDLPIYAAPDSSDIWAHQNLFEINHGNSVFENVAGVPPDYFNQDGQLWGNPLYNWNEHEKDGFSWWVDRLSTQIEIFDVVRIDHFRAFHDYWSIPSSLGNAKMGSWKSGPGIRFWNKINQFFPHRPFLAEDLGLITDEVRLLRNQAGLPGMAVLQFAFDGDPENLYLPHNLAQNLVLYLGTHDNDTVSGWYDNADEEIRGNFRSYLNVSGEFPSWDLLRFAYRTISPLVIVPVQDLLGLGSEARFNCPGEAIGNWQWRMSHSQLDSLFESSKYLFEQAKISGRTKNDSHEKGR